MTLDRRCRRATEGHALIDRYIVADFGRLADHDTHAVIDKTAPSDFCSWMDLDSCEESTDVAHKTCERRELALPKPVRQTMDQNRVKAWIRDRHFPRGSRCRIALED